MVHGWAAHSSRRLLTCHLKTCSLVGSPALLMKDEFDALRGS